MSHQADARVVAVVERLFHTVGQVSTRGLAQQVRLSERRLEELFKADTGVSIRAFVKCQRLHRAALLLNLVALIEKHEQQRSETKGPLQ